MITLILSEDEAVGLNRLLDLAVRQGGIQVAPLATVINQKLVEAVKTNQKSNGSEQITKAD